MSTSHNEAAKRAAMPEGTQAVLDRRTVFNANRNLLDIVQPGQTVLDVGCGSGSITAGIAELTGPTGHVTGIDPGTGLIDQAKQHFSHVTHLAFEVADIHTYQPNRKFHVVTAARVLQWLADPSTVLSKMAALLEKDGYLTILDYNHEKIRWEPAIPESMQRFYDAFLQWRADAGMDNRIGDNLAAMMEQQGLRAVTVTGFPEETIKGQPEFTGDIDIWAKVAETRGRQMVDDGYVSDELRVRAIEDYRSWATTSASSMSLYLVAVTGRGGQ